MPRAGIAGVIIHLLYSGLSNGRAVHTGRLPAPGSAYALEPKPNGGRVNLGRYGNTAQASLSSRGTVFAVW